MTIDITTMLAPVSDATPAGEEARSSETYEAVAAEIEKLTSLSGAAPIEWGLVEQQGTNILRSQSKDFMLAAWVSAAWTERHGIDGLRAGLELHAGLIESYWDTGFPPLKRLRGRRNALSWWVERATQWLETHELEPLPADMHETMVQAAGRIDAGLAEKDPDSPPLANFIRQIKGLDVIAPTPEADAPQATPGSVPGDQQTPPVAQAASANNAAARASTLPAPAGNPPKPSTTASTTLQAPSTSLPDQISSLDDIIGALNPVMDYLGHVSSALMALDRFHPLVIEISRFAARAALLELPRSNGGATALMPPPVAIADAFQAICNAGNADGMIEFCESRILAFPFWLDLDRQSARGFGMLGEPGARMRKAVIKNALSFTERLPGIELLTFSDGTPFAAEETRQWLQECRAEQSGSAATDAFGQTQQQAQHAVAEGRHDQAIGLYQAAIQSTSTGRDQFRARIALADLFIAVHADADPVPLVQPLVTDCQQYSLGAWEPELASKAWQTVLKACRQALAGTATRDDASRRERYMLLQEQALNQLARVDFAAASRLSG